MSSKRLYYSMLALIGILIVGLIGGAYEADQLLQQQSDSLVQNRLQAAVLEQEQIDLARAKQDIKKYQDLAAIAKSVVPQDKDQAQTVREVVNIANSNGILLSSITFPSSTLGIGVGGKPASGTVSSSKQQLSQLTPVKGIAGVYDLQLTVQSDSNHPVEYSRFISFLSALEHNRRTALVSSITLQPNDKNRDTLSFTLILDEYIKP
jgi:hypothetical protein